MDETSQSQGKVMRWGLISTLLWSLLISALFVLVQVFASIIYSIIFYSDVLNAGEEFFNSLESNGDFLAICTFSTSIFCSAAILFIVKLRKGARIKEYLGMRLTDFHAVVFWFVIITALIVMVDYLTVSLGRPLVPEYMLSAYSSSSLKGFFIFAILFGAPFFEELFFRGFLFEGIRSSRIGAWGAIFFTAFFWTVIHTQYDLYDLSYLFFVGIFFGIVKDKTRSIWLVMGLHFYLNLIATLQTVYLLS